MAGTAVTPVAVDVFLLILATLSIILRVISRKWSKAGLWWDDWLAIAALPFSFGTSIPFIIAAYHGFGKHGGDPTVFFHGLYFAELWYNLAITMVKLSVTCFYFRVFAVSRWSGRILWAIGAFATALGFSLAMASVFQCAPIRRYWEPTLPGTCVFRWGYFVGQAIPDIVCDFVLLIFPLFPLWKLQVKSRQKLGLVVVFTLGYMNPVISILRLVSFLQLGKNPTSDFNYIFVPPALWSAVEVAIGIFSCSIPSLAFLFRRLVKPCFPSSGSTSKSKRSYAPSKSNTHQNGRVMLSEGGASGSFEQLHDGASSRDGRSQYEMNDALTDNGQTNHWKGVENPDNLRQIRVMNEVDVSYNGDSQSQGQLGVATVV